MKFSISAVSLCLLPSFSVYGFLPTIVKFTTTKSYDNNRLYYDIQRDRSQGGGPNDNTNIWSILSNTERWISQTLADAKKDEKANPLSRKEVSYVCETSSDPAMILANIFRKTKEAREIGESHGQDQEALIDEKGGEHTRTTLRQTQVLVIPANEEFTKDFKAFNHLIDTINQARRSARDYITDFSLERLDEKINGEGDEDRDWVVSVNCAHLHPKYGVKTPEEEIQDMIEEDEAGEVDLNLQEYKKQRIIARRSPYPSVVIEVLAMAPPTFTSLLPPPSPQGLVSPQSVYDTNAKGSNKETDNENDDDDDVSSSPSATDEMKIDSKFVQQLEVLFSKSSLDEASSKNGDFYESIGSHIETFSAVTPLVIAQNWIDKNDPLFDISKCAFTISDATHVDEGYDFVFTNLGMQTSQFIQEGDVGVVENSGAQRRQYLVMPSFLSSSATSLEKFTIQSEKLIRALPTICERVDIHCFHPEHVDKFKRCPVPVIILQWKDKKE